MSFLSTVSEKRILFFIIETVIYVVLKYSVWKRKSLCFYCRKLAFMSF